MVIKDNYMDIDYQIDNKYKDDDVRPIGIPIYTPTTFYSDFIGKYNNYININDKNIDSKFISFYKIVKRNNKYFISSINGELYVGYDFNNLEKINIKQVFIFDISSDGNYMVYTINNEVYMYDFRTNQNKIIKNIELNMDDINNKYIIDIMFTPDNSRIIFCQNEYIYIWNIKEETLDKINISVINFTADDNYILISNYDKFSIYDINNKTFIINKIFDNNIIKRMKLVNDKIIIGFIDGLICIMNINSNNEIYLQNNYSGIKDIAISDNNNYMACVDCNNMLSVFDINANKHIYSLNGYRVGSIIITDNLEIIGTGDFNSISHFVMPNDFLNDFLNNILNS
jgi:hypothetical protein